MQLTISCSQLQNGLPTGSTSQNFTSFFICLIMCVTLDLQSFLPQRLLKALMLSSVTGASIRIGLPHHGMLPRWLLHTSVYDILQVVGFSLSLILSVTSGHKIPAHWASIGEGPKKLLGVSSIVTKCLGLSQNKQQQPGKSLHELCLHTRI